ncbi:hypothetical protein [Streptomyces sp. NBC_01089]|uniref:hypothetical protein n=1 Tax=Streptomyces sp. NBC_01089 TaxID=2903747 RepID=UPI00386B288E|nr:hypothetical protein OG510_15335 [Streptomyces sp. NBC_01089]
MASNARSRAVPALVLSAALALSVAGCSGGGGHHNPGIPEPKPGKVAPFSLAKLNTKYDVGHAASGASSSFVAGDRSGDVYAMNTVGGSPVDVLRMTPGGTVSRFARVDLEDKEVTGMNTAPDGGLLIGRAGGLIQVDQHGGAEALPTAHRFRRPVPVGARPDGSAVIVDQDAVWSLKDGRATKLHSLPKAKDPVAYTGSVDAHGTVYVQTGAITNLLVLEPGQKPRTLALHGRVPGSGPLSSLTAFSMNPARGGGFYAQLGPNPGSAVGNTEAGALVHVAPSGSLTVLAGGTAQKAGPASCAPGKQYPAVNTPCVLPWFVVQSGNRVLAIGSAVPSPDSPLLALALRADSE